MSRPRLPRPAPEPTAASRPRCKGCPRPVPPTRGGGPPKLSHSTECQQLWTRLDRARLWTALQRALREGKLSWDGELLKGTEGEVLG